jgi:hypothetical protein
MIAPRSTVTRGRLCRGIAEDSPTMSAAGGDTLVDFPVHHSRVAPGKERLVVWKPPPAAITVNFVV